MNNWRGILIKECNPKKRGTSFRIYWKCPLRLCLIPNCNFPHHLWAHSPTLSFPLQCAATKAHGHGLYVTTYSTGLLLYSSVADVPSLALCLHFTSFLFFLSLALSPLRAVNCAEGKAACTALYLQCTRVRTTGFLCWSGQTIYSYEQCCAFSKAVLIMPI